MQLFSVRWLQYFSAATFASNLICSVFGALFMLAIRVLLNKTHNTEIPFFIIFSAKFLKTAIPDSLIDQSFLSYAFAPLYEVMCDSHTSLE